MSTCGCIITFSGAVVCCDPTAAGPNGLARCKNEFASTILSLLVLCDLNFILLSSFRLTSCG